MAETSEHATEPFEPPLWQSPEPTDIEPIKIEELTPAERKRAKRALAALARARRVALTH